MRRKTFNPEAVQALEDRVRQGDRSPETLLALYNVRSGSGENSFKSLVSVAVVLLEVVSADEAVQLLDDLAIKTGGDVVTVGPDGVEWNGWRTFLPVSGLVETSQAISDVRQGAIFWDPVDSAVVLSFDDVVRHGTVDVDGELGDSDDAWDRFYVEARKHVESAYDENRREVSRFIFTLSSDGLMTMLSRYNTKAVMIDHEVTVGPSTNLVKLLGEFGVRRTT